MEHNDGRFGRSLGDEGIEVGEQIPGDNSRRVCGDDLSGCQQSLPSSLVLGSDERLQPSQIRLAGDVEGVEIEAS